MDSVSQIQPSAGTIGTNEKGLFYVVEHFEEDLFEWTLSE